MTILIIDDELEQLECIQRGLRSVGHEVTAALNAGDALLTLDQQFSAIDLVVTDYRIPDMNGIEILKNIRKHYGLLPVIMITAYGDKEVVFEALKNRCDGFLEKPFSLEALIFEIHKAIANRSQQVVPNSYFRILRQLIQEVNNPLSAISGNAQKAKSGWNDPAASMYIDDILLAAERIRAIHSKIIQVGLAEFDPEERVDLIRVMEDSLSLFENILSLQDIQVKKQGMKHPLFIRGNHFNIEEMFKNLLMNAIEAIEACKTKNLDILMKRQDFPPEILIEIKDSGCGMDDALIDKIYIPYFTNKDKGTGLGLYIVKEIVSRHGGSISVKSAPQKGTTFTVALPACSTDFDEGSGQISNAFNNSR